MIDRPANRRQLDLLVRAISALEPNRIPPPTRAEVTALLKLLISEHTAAGRALSPEAANE